MAAAAAAGLRLTRVGVCLLLLCLSPRVVVGGEEEEDVSHKTVSQY